MGHLFALSALSLWFIAFVRSGRAVSDSVKNVAKFCHDMEMKAKEKVPTTLKEMEMM